MTTRRQFLGNAAAVGGILSLTSVGEAAATFLEPRSTAPLRVLILGGTGFLGPHLVHVLTQRGHKVSMLNRGRRVPGLFEPDFKGVEAIQGDRSLPTAYDNLKGKRWDIVIETSGQQVPWTHAAAQALKDSVGRYVYISSTGVFLPYKTVEIKEDGPVPLKDDPPQPQPSYGVMKALSENEVRAAFGDRSLIVRPGYIVGPGDTSDRWTYWPVRVMRGGEILVPGKRTDPVQYVDVRDLSEWIIRMLENNTNGTFNIVGPARKQTMAEFVYGLGALTSAPLSWTWIEDYDFLKTTAMGTRQNGSPIYLTYAVPWVMVDGDDLGHMRIDNSKALAAGLTFRTLAETARDTIDWRASSAVPEALRNTPRYVMNPQQEQTLLAAWKKRSVG
jgi:nucleoside-diphosphate-sugar epimerase